MPITRLRSHIAVLFMCVVYGMAFWWVLGFLEADSCVDAGGVYEATSGVCIGFRPGEFLPIALRPWQFWLSATFLPLLPVAIILLLVRLFRVGTRGPDRRL